MGQNIKGFSGEWIAHEYLNSHCIEHYQADWTAIHNISHERYIVEVKHKRMYTGCEGFGVSLKAHQLDTRMKEYTETGQRTQILWVDNQSHSHVNGDLYDCDVYTAWLDEILQSGNYFMKKWPNSPKEEYVLRLEAFNHERFRYDSSKYAGEDNFWIPGNIREIPTDSVIYQYHKQRTLSEDAVTDLAEQRQARASLFQKWNNNLPLIDNYQYCTFRFETFPVFMPVHNDSVITKRVVLILKYKESIALPSARQ